MSSEVASHILEINQTNVDKLGFFCYKSKPKTPGYKQKLDWLEGRFSEGLRIAILYEGERSVGFVEYTPGEVAWRAVEAPNYLVIHCIWVVGKAKGKGYGSRLVEHCLEQAREQNKDGVAMVSSHRTWLAGNQLFLNNGFEVVGQAPPSFELLVRRTRNGGLPRFPTGWEERALRFGKGLSVVYAPQCPYLERAVNNVRKVAEQRGVKFQAVQLGSSQQVREQAPSAYGVFGIVYRGNLLSYRYRSPQDLIDLLEKG